MGMERLQVGIERWERGSAVVEYALLVALLAVACLVALNMLGQETSGELSSVASTVAAA